MMQGQNQQEALQKLQKQMVKIQLFEAPGAILVGLGLYGKFAAKGDAFHPFLNDPGNVSSMLILGGAIMAFGLYKSVKIAFAINQIKSATE